MTSNCEPFDLVWLLEGATGRLETWIGWGGILAALAFAWKRRDELALRTAMAAWQAGLIAGLYGLWSFLCAVG